MSKLLRILSIDGGGIRGILPGMLLSSLEKRLGDITGDHKTRIADHFDLLAGTSTGGILTCLYLCPDKATGRPRFTAEEAVDLYLSNGKKIFKLPLTPRQLWKTRRHDCRYVVKGMSSLMGNYFSDLRLSELLKPCLITSYDMVNRRSFFFTQHDANRDKDYEFYVRDVTRATSAAPGYFEPARVQSVSGMEYTLLDGGVFANNPALCAYAEAMQLFGSGRPESITPKDILMVSIGSGSYQSEGERPSKKEGPMVHTMSGVTETVDFQLKQLFGSARCDDNYLRFDPDLGMASPGMDDCRRQNLSALYQAGLMAVEHHSWQIDHVAQRLLENSEPSDRGMRVPATA